jgi:hypothetical protein
MVVSLERLVGLQDAARCSPVSLGTWKVGEGSGLSLWPINALVWLLSLPLPTEPPWLVCLVLMGWGKELILFLGECWNKEP